MEFNKVLKIKDPIKIVAFISIIFSFLYIGFTIYYIVVITSIAYNPSLIITNQFTVNVSGLMNVEHNIMSINSFYANTLIILFILHLAFLTSMLIIEFLPRKK